MAILMGLGKQTDSCILYCLQSLKANGGQTIKCRATVIKSENDSELYWDLLERLKRPKATNGVKGGFDHMTYGDR